MGGDVTVSGKTPTKALLKRAVKAAQMSKPVELLKTRDLGAIDKEIVTLSQELKDKIAQSKEIAAKGNTKSYTPEEAAFMDDIKAKGARLSQLKATKEKILKTTVKRQDRNIDTANVDLD
jgi:phage host-nuclease inhibitor protein Gam